MSLIAIVAGFLAGLIGKALAPPSRSRRLLVFAALVFGSTALLHIPLAFDAALTGFPPFGWDALIRIAELQGTLLLAVWIVIGSGWLCASIIKALFEDGSA